MTERKKENSKKCVNRTVKKRVNLGPYGAEVNGQEKTGRPVKPRGGLGLGKAGARRLGQMLKRAIQDNQKVHGTDPERMPNTPIRLLKHTAKSAKQCGPTGTSPGPRVSQLILNVVSQCKRRGGISMDELKRALADGGYDVTKNNSRVNQTVRGLVRRETLVQTAGCGASGSFRINIKKQTDEKRGRQRLGRNRNVKKKEEERANPKQTGKVTATERRTRKPTARTAKAVKAKAPKAPKPPLKVKIAEPPGKGTDLEARSQTPLNENGKTKARVKPRRRSPAPAGSKARPKRKRTRATKKPASRRT